MSYNYLPLDRKWLNFQQVKNLLDYDQLVSITFDAHEKILQCREYLDKKLADSGNLFADINAGIVESKNEELSKEQLQELSKNLIKSNAIGLGEEVPVDVVKLMLMLKIKSLSYGYGGVQIETVKRLMELYNNRIIPVVYTKSAGVGSGASSALSCLSLPLIGLGEVNYNGKKMASAAVLQQFKLEKISLRSNEGLALTTGTHFMSAYGMYCLKKSEQLMAMADAIAAVSSRMIGYNTQPLQEKLRSARNYKGHEDTIAALRRYNDVSELVTKTKPHIQPPNSVALTPQIHGTTKDAFGYVLGIFLNEINSVTESPVILPGDDFILNNPSVSEQPLALALDFLCIAVSELANVSERRMSSLVEERKDFEMTHSIAAGIVDENKQLCNPASIHSNSIGNNRKDFTGTSPYAATKCLRLISNVEKVLAIELMIASHAREVIEPSRSSPFMEKFISDFTEQIPSVKQHGIGNEEMMKAIDFVRSYQL